MTENEQTLAGCLYLTAAGSTTVAFWILWGFAPALLVVAAWCTLSLVVRWCHDE